MTRRASTGIWALFIAAFGPISARAQSTEGEPKRRSFDVFNSEDSEADEAPSQDDKPEGDELDVTPAPKARPKDPGQAKSPPAERPKPPPATSPSPSPPPPPAAKPTAAPPATSTKPGALVIIIAARAEDSSLALRIGEASTRQLARAVNLGPIELESAIVPDARRIREEEVNHGLEGVAKGTTAFEELDLETAGASLESSINTLLGYLDDLDPPQRRSLETAMFLYAATTLFEGETEGAESIFVALLLLSPRYTPDTGQFPTNVTSRFEALRSQVEERPTGGTHVVTTPPGADVFVDGSFRGASPIEVGGLADGDHVVVTRRLGYKPFGTLAPVTQGRMATLEIDLELSPGASVVESLRPELSAQAPPAIELGKKLGASKLAVLRLETPLSGARVLGQWLDVERGTVLGRVPELKVVEDPDVASTAIVKAILESEHAQERLLTQGPGSSDEGPLLERWWFWALIGGAAVATASVVAVAASSHSASTSNPGPRLSTLGF